MNDDIAEIGNIAIYNGILDSIIFMEDKIYIENRLEIGNSYEIIGVKPYFDGYWYKVRYKNLYVWSPKESFDIIIDMKKKYGLR